MSLADDPRPPLPDWITDTYTVLSTQMTDTDTGSQHAEIPAIDRSHAVNVLCTADGLTLEPSDANHAIKRLLDRGYFYEVGSELRLTTPPDHH